MPSPPEPLPTHDAHPLSSADAALVERAVQHIQTLDRQHRLCFALAVGKWLHEQFFADPTSPHATRGTRSGRSSITSIANDPRIQELGLGRTSLHNFVRVHVQISQADPALRAALEGLSLSHQVRLLRIALSAEKRRLAEQAARGRWTVLQLEAAITAEVEADRASAGHERPGRKALPVVVKRARAVVRAMDGLLGDDTDLAGLDEAARADLRQRLAAVLAALDGAPQ